MSLLPTDDKARKFLPLFKQLLYFPKALREMTKVSVVNNVRYNPDRDPADINWNRGKSKDQLGSAFRHMMEVAVDGKVFEDVPEEAAKVTGITKVYVLAEAWWRIGAALELAIEEQEAKVPFKPLELPDPAHETGEHFTQRCTCGRQRIDYRPNAYPLPIVVADGIHHRIDGPCYV